jgi:hypothetical protein
MVGPEEYVCLRLDMVTKQKVSNRKGKSKHQTTAAQPSKRVRHKVAAEELPKTHRKTGASVEQSPDKQPSIMPEQDQTRASPFGATAGQIFVRLNRKFVDIAKRNVNTSFDLAAGLARAKNLSEVMQLQLDYWRTLLRIRLDQTDETRQTDKLRGLDKT